MKSKNDTRNFYLYIDRKNIFNSSYEKMAHIPIEKLITEFSANFEGEPGIDVGGVKRDYFNSISKEIFNPDLGLF